MHSGILVIDKEPGMTSFDVVRNVRKKLGVKKVGHAGTLDPIATGVLPVCLGKATKLVQFIMAGHKVYQGTMRLGIVTDTYDSDGKITEKHEVGGDIDFASVQAAADRFTGAQLQAPPPFSAVKHNGKPLYRLARKGIVVEKEPRPINVFSFEILNVRLPDVEFRIHCTKGTYVRSLVNDLGQTLGPGGHLLSLRRTRNGHFGVDRAVTLEELDAIKHSGRLFSVLISPDEALSHIPGIEIDTDTARDIRCGRPVSLGHIAKLLKGRDMPPQESLPYLRLYVKRSGYAGKTKGAAGYGEELVSVVAWPGQRRLNGENIIHPIRVWT